MAFLCGMETMSLSNPFLFNMVAAPESRCTACMAGGVIRVHAVIRAIVRPVCGAVAGMGCPSPMS